jgi:hypothetical protein
MGRAICGHGKVEEGAYHLSDPQGKMLDHSWNADRIHHFFCFNAACKSEGFVSYKQTFVVEIASRIYFPRLILFFSKGKPARV